MKHLTALTAIALALTSTLASTAWAQLYDKASAAETAQAAEADANDTTVTAKDKQMFGLSWFGSDPENPRPLLQAPAEVRSENGVCKATVHIRKQEVQAGDQTLNTSCFNGRYTGPTLRFRAGDTLELNVINDGEYNTNIHFHGMQVSPDDYGDSVFTIIPMGHEYTYRIKIPEYQQPGIYWYHAHSHQTSQRQVMQGVTGTIIVEGALDRYPALKDVKESIVVLHDYQKGLSGEVVLGIQISWPTYRLVNDQKFPDIEIKPGEVQFLRIANESTNIYYNLDFGGEKFWVVGVDGNPTVQMTEATRWPLAAGARVEVMVRFDKPGRYKLHTSEIRTGPNGDGYSAENLLTMVCMGDPVANPIALPQTPVGPCPLDDLSKVTPDVTRTIVFSETPNDFRINNRYFDGTRIDQLVRYGDNEKWIVRNSSDELHVFHIHQLDFQILKINGVPQPFNMHRDTFSMPVRGEVEIMIPFTRPCVVGDFVFHCHILCHEDGGMMQKIRVYDPSKPMPPVRPGDGYGPEPEDAHLPLKAADANAVGGPFELRDAQGAEFTDDQLSDGLALLCFGYTDCTGACPRNMATYADVADILKTEANPPELRYVFVSVDPSRDEGAKLKDYASKAPVPLIALTGDPETIVRTSRTFGAAYEPQPKRADGSYTVRHSTDTCLVGPGGRIFKRFELGADPKVIAAAVNEFATRVPRKAVANASTSNEGGSK